MVAVLHDVVEDTPVSLDDIRAAGFSQEVIDALALVTHQQDQPLSYRFLTDEITEDQYRELMLRFA
jgi:(p)ppGpp synthase/HD superfamily hydrolase